MNAMYKFSGWTDGEIRAHYREAADKLQSINILSDLTLMPKNEIRRILGVQKPQAPKRIRYDWTEARRLYDMGMTDMEISRETGIPPSPIFYWRRREGLKKNEGAR